MHAYRTKGHDNHAMQGRVPRPSKLMKVRISRERGRPDRDGSNRQEDRKDAIGYLLSCLRAK
jgi:hypothetical protein